MSGPGDIVHILRAGRPLCGFLPGVLPGQWPAGHKWVRLGSMGATCARCLEVEAETGVES